MDKLYTVEELLSDETFIDFCHNENSPHRKIWSDIASNPEQKKIADEARLMLGLLSPSLPQHEIETEVEKLRETLWNKEDFQLSSNRPSKNRAVKVLVYSCIFLAITVTALYYFLPKSSTKTLISSFETKLGERKQYILPDGSTVILNSNSGFSFKNDFGKKERRIELKGDAFFKVAKDPSKPFVVYSNGFSTTAIGTAFYVHAGSDYSVDLLEGKVRLEKNTSGETLYITAGQKASWTKTNSSFTRQHYDTLSLNQWIKGVLAFHNTPVDEAFEQIEQWYAVDIEDRRFNPGTISINGDYVNAPLEDVLKIICFSLSCTYQIDGNKIVIQ
jgi:ferric-dicitrate binding protein FerR (iron transport regulator)